MSADKWAVVLGEDGQGNPLNPGDRETAVDQPTEAAARQFHRDSVSAALSGRYKSVRLRKGREVLESWPSTSP